MRSEIRAQKQLESVERYLSRRYSDSVTRSANPSISAALGDRDPQTGRYTLATPTGTLTANLIGGALAPNAVIPSVTRGRTGSYADGKP